MQGLNTYTRVDTLDCELWNATGRQALQARLVQDWFFHSNVVSPVNGVAYLVQLEHLGVVSTCWCHQKLALVCAFRWSILSVSLLACDETFLTHPMWRHGSVAGGLFFPASMKVHSSAGTPPARLQWTHTAHMERPSPTENLSLI